MRITHDNIGQWLGHRITATGPTGLAYTGDLIGYLPEPSLLIHQDDGTDVSAAASFDVTRDLCDDPACPAEPRPHERTGWCAHAPAAVPGPVPLPQTAQEYARRITLALDALPCAVYDGRHHHAWVADQVARALTGNTYPQWVAAHPGWADMAAEGCPP